MDIVLFVGAVQRLLGCTSLDFGGVGRHWKVSLMRYSFFEVRKISKYRRNGEGEAVFTHSVYQPDFLLCICALLLTLAARCGNLPP